MRASARPLSHPAPWAVPRSRSSGNARRATGGHLRLCALPSAPFWARQYTRLFLADCCPGISDDTTETAQLIVSELVTNAARASASTLGVIGLSLRPTRNKLIIEVCDQSADPPVLAPADRDAEHGRGLVLVDALSEEWGYCDEPHGGKVVYAIVRLTLALSRQDALGAGAPAPLVRQRGRSSVSAGCRMIRSWACQAHGYRAACHPSQGVDPGKHR
jgi:anti-sigma regulatory factor (Ser/Thr protein kinase)